MSKQWILGIAFVLLLASLPLISIGTTREDATLRWAGLALLVAGALIAPVSRYLLPEEEDDAAADDGDEESGKDRDATEPAEIGVEREDDGAASRDAGRTGSRAGVEDKPGEPRDPGSATLGEHERRARAHEQRAEAHRERARAHEELAEAEEERARGEADADGEEPTSEGKDAR
jgi:chromatin segregation and condensation protein Rec8/ScpA/Scc1 (kleisin family)